MTLYLLFTRVAPVVAIAEVKSILKTAGDQYTGPNKIHHHSHDDHGHGVGAGRGDDHGNDHLRIVSSNVGAGAGVMGMTPEEPQVIETPEPVTYEEPKETALPVDNSQEEVAAAPDNLKKIEGIGPKVEGILNGGGIYTFAQLANAPISRIKELLEAAGPRYKMQVPDSWPEQAGLARDGKWDDLDDLQDRLDGGKYV